jgi:predicted dehydrogenase
VRFLIAGLGSIGRRHLRNLLALGEKDILLYRTLQSTLPDDELAGFPVEHDLETALAQHPDAVIVANPTSLHLEVAIPAAQSGCHILLEKPVSHSLEGITELSSAVEFGGGQVLVGYQFRFHPGLQRIRQLLGEDAIGKPLSAHAHWGEYLPGWHPWEDYRRGYSARSDLGGGVVLTLSHPLDYLCWMLGDVDALWAFTGRLSGLDLEVEDTAEIGLRFSNGALAGVHLDYCQRPPAHWLEVIGEQGAMRWDNANGEVHLYRASQKTWETFSPPDGFDRDRLFLEQIRHFIAVAHGETQPLCTLADGIRALKLALAAHASQDGGRVVRKPASEILL